jgi:hypothetical protein
MRNIESCTAPFGTFPKIDRMMAHVVARVVALRPTNTGISAAISFSLIIGNFVRLNLI